MKINKYRKLPRKTGMDDVPQSKSVLSKQSAGGGGGNSGRKTVRPKVVVNHVISNVPRCVCHDAEYFVLNYLDLFHVGGGCGSPYGRSLDTLRENCGIIRKQASTDGGVLWEVVRVYVVQVR
ncbi:hypothetical protein TNCV_3457061 [Trichonephila clavipes]|nr:hypothetical protein TNCV_3457061 [Trichonephila clavipes]